MPDTPQPEPRPGRSSVVPLHPAAGDETPTVLGLNPNPTPPAEAFALPPGSQLAHFEVTGPLGSGGMASVFKARDLTLGRDVALKILPPALARDPDAVTRFKLEARAAAKLNHENVARVFFTGEDRGLHFIAFEFVDGDTLRAVIDRLGTVPPAECVRHMLDVAAGLQHASERGVVHRDVKPSNIIVTPDGRAKLIDMGLARSLEPHSVNGGVTQSGVTLGTFDYISPEQAIDPRRADVRSDVYSLGCTFYHALTGRPPVPEGNAARKLAAHQGEAPTDPRLINFAVPDELAVVLDRMMAKNPARRYQTAAELVTELVRVGRVIGVPLDAADSHPAHGGSSARLKRPVPAAGLSTAAILGVSAVAVAVLVLIGVWSKSPAPPPPPWADPAATRPTAGLDPVAPEAVAPRAVPKVLAVATADELLKAVRDGVPKLILSPGVTYDLSATEGLVVSGKVIEWECAAEPKAATVRVAAGPLTAARAGEARPGALTFHKCEVVKLHGLRFEVVQAGEAADDPVGVALIDVPRVEVAECRFETGGPLGSSDGTGVYLSRGAAAGAVTARNCFFGLKNWAAVELVGHTTAAFTECGFVTSRNGIEVSAADPADPTAVALKHTTFLLNGAATAVWVNRGGRADVAAAFSLFAAPTTDPAAWMMTEPERKPAVLRFAEGGDGSLATADAQPTAVYLVELPAGISGAAPEQLKSSPWAATTKSDPERPWTVLELNPKVKALRPPGAVMLGVRSLPTDGRKLYDEWPPPSSPVSAVKVWYPNPTAEERDSLPANVFTSLDQAVAALNKGKDVLEVRGSGVIEVPQAVVLTEPRRAITVRAEKGSSPVLKPLAEGRRDGSLFRLEAGELTLDGLAFLVRPTGSDGTAAVVGVSGGKRCELRNCVVTLDEPADARAAVVALADVSDQMKKEAVGRPVIAFENCLLRGRGRLVRAAATVPMDVSVTNVGAAVSGPLFEFGPPAHPPATGATVSVQLTHLTAALGGPLFDARAGRKAADDKPLYVPLDVRAEGSLFVALDAGPSPLVQLSGYDPAAPDRYLTWSAGTTANGYSGWGVFAEVPGDDGTGEPKRLDAAEWRKWSGERESAVGRAVFAKLPTGRGLSGVRATDLEPTTNPFDDDTGVKAKLLPKVSDEAQK